MNRHDLREELRSGITWEMENLWSELYRRARGAIGGSGDELNEFADWYNNWVYNKDRTVESAKSQMRELLRRANNGVDGSFDRELHAIMATVLATSLSVMQSAFGDIMGSLSENSDGS